MNTYLCDWPEGTRIQYRNWNDDGFRGGVVFRAETDNTYMSIVVDGDTDRTVIRADNRDRLSRAVRNPYDLDLLA